MVAVADVGPDAALLALPFAGSLDRHTSVIGVDNSRLPNSLCHQLHERPNQLASGSEPRTHRAASHFDLLPREDVFETVERQVIAELADSDIGHKSWSR